VRWPTIPTVEGIMKIRLALPGAFFLLVVFILVGLAALNIMYGGVSVAVVEETTWSEVKAAFREDPRAFLEQLLSDFESEEDLVAWLEENADDMGGYIDEKGLEWKCFGVNGWEVCIVIRRTPAPEIAADPMDGIIWEDLIGPRLEK